MIEDIDIVADAAVEDPIIPFGYAFAALLRALLVGMKKGVILTFVKKKAFVKLGSMTSTTTRPTAAEIIVLSRREKLLELSKATVLGATVFGSYEYFAYHLFPKYTATPIRYLVIDADVPNPLGPILLNSPLGPVVSHVQTAITSPVWAHVGAGVCSGFCHNMALTGWEMLSAQSFQPTHPFSFLVKRSVHHSIGYASLFGTYEAVRRTSLDSFRSLVQTLLYDSNEDQLSARRKQARRALQKHDWILKREDGVVDVTPATVLTTLFAGSMAGQVHHVVSHVTRQWAHSNITSWSTLVKQGSISLPTIRSTIAAAGPTSLIFLAFQFGGELTERIITNRSEIS